MYLTLLDAFRDVPDGTYNESAVPVAHTEGYQVSFHQVGMKYSEEEYDRLVEEFISLTEQKPEIGRFNGLEPHISFCVFNEEFAIRICRKYNQIGYWDWRTMKCKYVKSV